MPRKRLPSRDNYKLLLDQELSPELEEAYFDPESPSRQQLVLGRSALRSLLRITWSLPAVNTTELDSEDRSELISLLQRAEEAIPEIVASLAEFHRKLEEVSGTTSE